MAVPVTAAGTSFEAGTPVALFPTRIVDGGTLDQGAREGETQLQDRISGPKRESHCDGRRR